MTNQEFADSDYEFRAACERAGVTPNKRRAARWRAGTGYVYGYRVGGPNYKDVPHLEYLQREVLTPAAK